MFQFAEREEKRSTHQEKEKSDRDKEKEKEREREVEAIEKSRAPSDAGALRQARSRATTLEAEVAVARAEGGHIRGLLQDSERALSLTRGLLKDSERARERLESQLREMDVLSLEVRRQQDLQVELSAVHAEKVKLRSLLEQKATLVTQQEAELSSLQEQIAIYQEDFRVNSELVDNQDIRLRQRESEIESLKSEVAALKAARGESLSNTKRLESMVMDKDKEVDKLSALLHTVSSDASTQKARADATAAIREDLLGANTENTKLTILLQQANVDLTLQKQQIETLEQQISQLAARPGAMVNHMEELEQLVDQQSNTLAGLHDAIAQRDALIAFFEQETSLKDKTIEDQEDMMTDKEHQIKKLEEALKKASISTKMPPTKNVAHLEAHIRDLQAEQVRYRAEIKAYLEDIRVLRQKVLHLEASPRRRGKAGGDPEDTAELQEEAAAVAAELTSLCVLVRQAGRDSTAFSALRESEIGRDFLYQPAGQASTGPTTLAGSLATIKRESDALRAAVTAFYAESVGNDCAVQ